MLHGKNAYLARMLQAVKTHFSSVIFGVAMILTAYVLGGAYINRNKKNDTITVVGKAEKNFISDQIVWSGAFSRYSSDLKEAYALLNADRALVKEYLVSKGIDAKTPVFSAVDIEKVYNRDFDNEGRVHESFAGYRLSQTVEIASKEVNKVEGIAREITELINRGLEFNSQAPDYYYTQLAELKKEMIASATRDAKERAQRIAEESGTSLGSLKSGDMGVFQITAPNSNEEYSWGGSFNTSSKEKNVSITMSLVFNIN
jgi:hypothetical protein